MSNDNEPVSTPKRVIYSLIDAAVFCGVWWLTIIYARVKPPAFAFMSAYTPQEYRNYIYAVTVMATILLVNSIVMHWLFGGSIGKIVTGCRTYRLDGFKLRFKDAFMRALFCFGVALSILAPGPIVAAIFGAQSDRVALGMLGAGFIFWIITMMPLRKARTMHEDVLGIITVRIQP